MYNTNWMELAYIIPVSILGMFCWSVFIQGHWVVRTYWIERLAFLGLAFLLVNPSHLTIGPFGLGGVTFPEIHVNQHLANALALALMALIYLWQRARKAKAGPMAPATAPDLGS